MIHKMKYKWITIFSAEKLNELKELVGGPRPLIYLNHSIEVTVEEKSPMQEGHNLSFLKCSL